MAQLEARRDGRRRRARRPRAASPCARATFVSAAGAIGTPALLLRSGVPDPHGIVGRRTFLHPTLVSAALMPERVDAYYGAPQSVYSDHFLDTHAARGPDGLQARGAAGAPDPRRDHAAGLRRRACGVDARPAAPAGAARADARRLPSGQPRRHRRAAQRRHAGARLPAERVRVRRRAARVPDHGRAAVRRRRDARDAGARRRRGVLVDGAGARAPSPPSRWRRW